MVDLCKLFGVEEGEEFKFSKHSLTHRINNNGLEVLYEGEWGYTAIAFNVVITSEIEKVPKKKEFTEDELAIFRCMDKKYKWVTRDRRYELTVFENKPKKITNNRGEYWNAHGDWLYLGCFENMFQAITTEDEEPVFIDDYVERGVE